MGRPSRRSPKGRGSRPIRRRLTVSASCAAIAVALVSAVAWTDDAGRASRPASAALPRSSPETQGISSAAILDFVDAADRRIEQMHSVMILRHGHVVAEGWWAPYSADTPHTMFSLTKSFTSTGVGLAIADGRMSLDDPVLSFFPDEAPAEPSETLKAMRVRDLLSMSTGHEKEAPWQSEANWARAFLAQPVPHKPGTHFLYNTPASYMLSAIVQKVTGAPLVEYLRPRLFEPLGIEGPQWDTNREGVTIGGYGLHLRTEDLARFGQLYLQEGLWRGQRLLPAEWVEAATARQTSNGSNPASDWDQGYGYQFWRCRRGAYRGDGAFGQYCIVMPAQDAVVVITSGVKDMQSVMNLVWERLLPAMQPKPLAPDREGRRRLGERLTRLAVPPQSGAASSAQATGYVGKTYSFPSNERRLESIALESDARSQEMTLVARVGGSEQRLACGSAGWRKGRLAYGGPEQPVAASGAWTADDTYSAKVCFYETPFCVTMALRFGADGLTFDSESNVAFGSTKHPTLSGTLATPNPGAAPAGGAGSADAGSDVR